MLKYLKSGIVFQEVPDETSLALSISGCNIHCKGCNQRELWEDKGIDLDLEELKRLLEKNQGITCLVLLGGEHDIDSLVELFMYAHKRIKTAWYCGLDMIPKSKIGILAYLDWIKMGHFDMELGGLKSPTTNQRLYQKVSLYNPHTGDSSAVGWIDITSRLQKPAIETTNSI